jgi:predicted metal-binding protein
MPFAQVTPVVDPTMRAMCVKPYPLHPRGCPNFGKKEACPPKIGLFKEHFDLAGPFWAIWNVFALGRHVEALRTVHPDWSDRQLYCCLYWQPGARKALEAEIQTFQSAHAHDGFLYTRCPEAMGINITETMRVAGVILEWPPATTSVQVALAGRPLRREPERPAPISTGQLGLFG